MREARDTLTPSRALARVDPLPVRERAALRWGAVALALLAAGCKQEATPQHVGCAADSDCGSPTLFRCVAERGECLCRTDGACKNGERCNSAGYCQASIGCYENLDCVAGQFCDVASNLCMPVGRCSSDAQCAFGEICDIATNQCAPGCRGAGDCPLNAICVCAQRDEHGVAVEASCACDGVTDADRAGCQVGRCDATRCVETAGCPQYGQVCRFQEGDRLGHCVSDKSADRPYCEPCADSQSVQECGNKPTFCLVNSYDDSESCGVDCAQGQECAKGYECGDVRVVWTVTRCELDSQGSQGLQCLKTEHPCSSDADCRFHGTCLKQGGSTTGFCQSICTVPEGGVNGYCSCLDDSHCPQEYCDLQRGVCSITKRPCTGDEGCRTIRCVDSGTQGMCLIGANCKPMYGLTCSDLLAQ